RQRDVDRTPDRVAVERPHFTDPAQGEAAPHADEVILRDAREDRHEDGDHEKRADEKREAELQPVAQGPDPHPGLLPRQKVTLILPPPRPRPRATGPARAPPR